MEFSGFYTVKIFGGEEKGKKGKRGLTRRSKKRKSRLENEMEYSNSPDTKICQNEEILNRMFST